MLNNHVFYHGTTRKAVIAFGNLFKNITIRRDDSDGNVQQRMVVPLRYMPKEKFLETLANEERRSQKSVMMIYPRIAFEVLSINYDSMRKLKSTGKAVRALSDNTLVKFSYIPAPYIINFNLHIASRHIEDNLQILEQILPYFQPYFNVPINLIPSMNIVRDCPVILNSVFPAQEYEAQEDPSGNKKLVTTMDFNMKVEYFGSIREQKIITKVTAQMYPQTDRPNDLDDTLEPQALSAERTVVEPDPLDATIGDDYGFTETFTTNYQDPLSQ